MSASGDIHQLARQLEESQRRIDLIRKVTLELNAISSLPQKLNNILRILYAEFGINHSMILLPDRHHATLTIKASFGYEEQMPQTEIPFGSGIIGLAAVNRRPINITGLRRKKQYIRTVSAGAAGSDYTHPGLDDPESQIAIPLIANEELVAVLMAESYNNSVFSKEDENFLITLSQSIGVSIQNAMLFDNMEDIIADRTAALQKSNYTKDRLFSIISHDLRGPVTSFHNISKLIHHYNKQGDKEKLDKLSVRIDQSVNRLHHLLDNLLNWTLTHTDGIRCVTEQIETGRLLHEVVAIYEEQVLAKDLHVIIEGHLTVNIAADYNTLSAVFRNIFSNALKYTPRGGRVYMCVEDSGEQVLVTCRDNGVGIPPERLATLFHLTEKGSTPGTENEKGTGLGLLVARDFVRLNKGDIRIDSVPGQGTAVFVTLPVFHPPA